MSNKQENLKRNLHSVWTIILITIILLAILSIALYITRNNDEKWSPNNVYTATMDQIEVAVTIYAENHNSSYPIFDMTYTNLNCFNCYVLNIDALNSLNGGTLQTPPDGLNLSPSGNDNCNGNASLGCINGNHYIWIVDNYGNVYSYCTGAGCETNNSGYQGVWP